MEGKELVIQTRAFPSQGRVRVHESLLPFLGVKEGEPIEVQKLPLIEHEKPKQVTVSIYGDAMVEDGVIRMSPEDIAALNAAEGEIVNAKRKIPITEVISKKASKTGKAVQEGAEHFGESIKKGASGVSAKILPEKEAQESRPKE